MELDCAGGLAAAQPGEWIATARGRIIAHGFDFQRVADEACRQADDIAFDRIPFRAPATRHGGGPPLLIPAFPARRRARRPADALPRRAAAPLPPPH